MSALEDLLAEQLTREGIEFEREYKFPCEDMSGKRHTYRVDFALPSLRIFVEVQGGIYMRRSGHNSPAGLKRDYNKCNLAQLAGWRYLQFTADDVNDGKAVDMVIRFMEAYKA